jgi:light-regulated signal transduction histidine kinase (bacteriophytochrome)
MWPAVTENGGNVGIVIQVTESTAVHEHAAATNQALIISSVRQHALAEKAEALNVLLLKEIAEHKRADEELRRAKEHLEELSFSMTHDLQEPLRTVAVYTQLLARNLGPKIDTDERMYVKQILLGSIRMGDLIQDLLTYLRLGASGNSDQAPFSCDLALQDALFNLKGSIEQCGAEITAEPLPRVNGNLLQLGQVFQNLISNALKYRKVNVVPVVRISADRQEGCWLFSVRDNGIGFRPEYSTQIFGVLKRLHSTEYPGTGIGLAICKRIVESHGGRIWASGEEGVGATFYFTLPEVTSDEPSVPTP